MGCENTVQYTYPSGWDYKTVTRKCGTTDHNGGTLLCNEPNKCSNQHSDGRPWYICPHGNDVSEYDCGACEMGA